MLAVVVDDPKLDFAIPFFDHAWFLGERNRWDFDWVLLRRGWFIVLDALCCRRRGRLLSRFPLAICRTKRISIFCISKG